MMAETIETKDSTPGDLKTLSRTKLIVSVCSLVVCISLCSRYLSMFVNMNYYFQISGTSSEYSYFPKLELCPLSPVDPLKVEKLGIYFTPRHMNYETEVSYNDDWDVLNKTLKELLEVAAWNLGDVVKELRMDNRVYRYDGTHAIAPFWRRTYGPIGACFMLDPIPFKNKSATLTLVIRNHTSTVTLDNVNGSHPSSSLSQQDRAYAVRLASLSFHQTSPSYRSYVLNRLERTILQPVHFPYIKRHVYVEPYEVNLLGHFSNSMSVEGCHEAKLKTTLVNRQNCTVMDEHNLDKPVRSFCSQSTVMRWFYDNSIKCGSRKHEKFWKINFKGRRRLNWDTIEVINSSPTVKTFDEVASYSSSRLFLDIGNIVGFLLGYNLMSWKGELLTVKDTKEKPCFRNRLTISLKMFLNRFQLSNHTINLVVNGLMILHACTVIQTFMLQSPQSAVSLKTVDAAECQVGAFPPENTAIDESFVKPWLAALSGAHAFYCRVVPRSALLKCLLDEIQTEHPFFTDYPECQPSFNAALKLRHVVSWQVTNILQVVNLEKIVTKCKSETPFVKAKPQVKVCLVPELSQYYDMSGASFSFSLCGLSGFYLGFSLLPFFEKLLPNLQNFSKNVHRFSIKFVYRRAVCSLLRLSLTLITVAIVFVQVDTFYRSHPIFTKSVTYKDVKNFPTVSACPWPQYDLGCLQQSFFAGNLTNSNVTKCETENLLLKYSIHEAFKCTGIGYNFYPVLSDTLLGYCVTCTTTEKKRTIVHPEVTDITQVNPFPDAFKPFLMYFIVHDQHGHSFWDGITRISVKPRSFKMAEVEEYFRLSGYSYNDRNYSACIETCYKAFFDAYSNMTATTISLTQKIHLIYQSRNLSDISELIPPIVAEKCSAECRWSRHIVFKGTIGFVEDFSMKSSLQVRMFTANASMKDITFSVLTEGKFSQDWILESAYNIEQLASEMTGVVTFAFGVSLVSLLTWIARVTLKSVSRTVSYDKSRKMRVQSLP